MKTAMTNESIIKLLFKFTFRTYVLYEVIFNDRFFEKTTALSLTFILLSIFYYLDSGNVKQLFNDYDDNDNGTIIINNTVQYNDDVNRLKQQNEQKINILDQRWNDNMLNLILQRDIYNTKPAINFKKLSKVSPCLFAKSSKIASHTTWNYDLTLEENILQSLPLFYIFIKNISKIDGFAFEIPSNLYGRNLTEFSITVKRVLTCLAENDPTQLNCMEANFIDKAGWCFSFDTETFFVTTFGDIYPKSHSRHCHLKNKMYVLIQPEESFYKKKLPEDHGPNSEIKDIRDKIRNNFAKKLCPYYVPPTKSYPMAHHIVKPLIDVESSYHINEQHIVNNNKDKPVIVKKDHIVEFYLHNILKIKQMNAIEYKNYIQLS